MSPEQRRIYRQHALEHISSPERLDQLLRVVRPQSWLLLLSIGFALALAVGWSVVGRIPITAEGSAILVRPRQVVAFQAPSEGQVAALFVRVGERVAKGDLLARIALPELEKDLEQQRARLANFDSRSGELVALEHEQALLELRQLADQRGLLQGRAEALKRTAEAAKLRSDQLIAEQRENLATARELSEELERTLQRRYDSFRLLQVEGLISSDLLVEARSRTIDKQLALAGLSVQEQELRLREQQALDSYEQQLDQVLDLGLQVKELELREKQVNNGLRRSELSQAGERQEVERRIEQLRALIASEGNLLSEYDGRIVELATLVGQRVELGTRLGKLEIEDLQSDLMALAYFDVEEGKRVRPGLRMLVSPAIVQRERFGSIVGRVQQVSDYPVTIEAAGNQIGDQDLARALLAGRSRIEVLASLVLDARTPSGFEWTSGQGPGELRVTPGTTAEVRVTIDERAPITFVLPFLRSLAGT